MKYLAVSFHTPVPWREHWFGFLCLGGSIIVAAVTTWFGFQTYAEHQRWKDYLVTLRQVSAPRQSDANADDGKESIKAELQAATDVIEQLDVPWAGLFSVLEGTYSDNAILLGAEPDPGGRSIRLTAEAKDMSSMLAFVRMLRESKVLADAYVISHVVNQQDAQRPIRFVVSSHWLDVAAPPPADAAVSPSAAAEPEKKVGQ